MKFELTKKEAMELLLVAGNGYGDGDYYGLNGPSGVSPARDAKYFKLAYEKVATKLKLEHIHP